MSCFRLVPFLKGGEKMKAFKLQRLRFVVSLLERMGWL